MRSRAALAWYAFAAVVCVAFCVPQQAFAHAELLGTTPAPEEVLEAAPSEVTLEFSEPVSESFGGIRAYGPDGESVDDGSVSVAEGVVTIPVKDAGNGSYAVSYRITSADGHPIDGLLIYHVGSASSGGSAVDQAEAQNVPHRGVQIAFGVARGVYIMAILLLAGGAVYALLMVPSWRQRYLIGIGIAGVAATLAAFVLDAAITGAFTLGEVLTADIMREQAQSVYGKGTLVRLGALTIGTLLCIALLRTPAVRLAMSVRALLAVTFVALAATLSLTGHAVAEGLSARLTIDMLHSIAAALWLGGLLQLWLQTRNGTAEYRGVQRYSRTAFASVVVLVASGMYASWIEIIGDGSLAWEAVSSTTYGRIVATKVLLFLALIPLAHLNRTRHVPLMEQDPGRAGHYLQQYVRAEILIATGVIALTAWLVQTPPAQVDVTPERVEVSAAAGDDATLQFVVDPAVRGGNEIHAYVNTQAGEPDVSVTEMTLEVEIDEDDKANVESLDIPLAQAGPGHWTATSATIPFAGTWTFTANVQRGEFDVLRVKADVEIAPG